MAQTSNLTNQDDFFVPGWPESWATDQSTGLFETQPNVGLLPETTPMASNTPDLAATNDIRSLHIMICCRLDKIESSLAQMNDDFSRIRDNTEKAVQVGNQVKDMIDSLRKSLGRFSKTLFAYFRGDQGTDANMLGSGCP